jgi:hypothetical protein
VAVGGRGRGRAPEIHGLVPRWPFFSFSKNGVSSFFPRVAKDWLFCNADFSGQVFFRAEERKNVFGFFGPVKVSANFFRLQRLDSMSTFDLL